MSTGPENTLQYRLNRIQKIAHVDLEDPYVRQNLMNALMIETIYPYT